MSYLIGTNPRILANALLNKEARESDDEEHDEVGNHEGATSILVGHIGEPPDVAQPHRQTQAGEEELKVVAPALATHPHSRSGLEMAGEAPSSGVTQLPS